MTLVVGRRFLNNQLCIISDTLISNEQADRAVFSKLSHGVKIALPRPDLAIAFSNSSDLAERKLLEYRAEPGGFGFTIEFFKKASAQTGNEFLVGFAGPKRLFAMRNGQCQESASSVIGDRELAWPRFQAGVNRDLPRPFGRVNLLGKEVVGIGQVSDQINRMLDVIDDKSIPSVGGFATVVVSDGVEFRFLKWSTIVVDPENIVIAPDGASTVGADSESKLQLSISSPKIPGVSAVNYHYADVNRSFLFYSPVGGFPLTCRTFQDLSGAALRAAIEAESGIIFDLADPTPQDGSEPGRFVRLQLDKRQKQAGDGQINLRKITTGTGWQDE